jgi:uncharacterized protein YecA (UPF0149 family)
MQSIPNNDICEIMKLEGNNMCIDCSIVNPTFASVNNAVFLCEKCAIIHKNLGPNISLVKSLTNDQFSPEEIALLKIGGNTRFSNFMKEYGIQEEQNKEFKYHLKLAEYYRLLLLAEVNKEQNPEQYQYMINNRPSAEIGLQLMESVTVESIKKANEPKSEIAKDVSNIADKVGSFFSSIGQKMNDFYQQSGIGQKVDEARAKVNESLKSFGENHPSIQNAATKTGEALTAAKNLTEEAINKVAESETFKNLQGAVNNKYNEVMNSETMTNFAKKAEEQYINLKIKAGFKPDNVVNNVNNIPQDQPNINNEGQK